MSQRRRSPPIDPIRSGQSSESSLGTSLDGESDHHRRRRKARKDEGFYSERAVQARAAIHRQHEEDAQFMNSMLHDLHELRREQKRERKRVKKRNRLQRKEDKREQKRQMLELHAEFDERRRIRTEAREYRALEREVGPMTRWRRARRGQYSRARGR